MPRIIAGAWRGHTLPAIREGAARPTTDRARTVLFDTLWDVMDARVLDLYSGSGALGLEALSRGAASLISVDAFRPYILAQQAWIASRDGTFKGIVGQVEAQIQLIDGPFDLIFADPPYAVELHANVIDAVVARMSEESRFVYERRRSESKPIDHGGLTLWKEKVIADTRIQIYTLRTT